MPSPESQTSLEKRGVGISTGYPALHNCVVAIDSRMRKGANHCGGGKRILHDLYAATVILDEVDAMFRCGNATSSVVLAVRFEPQLGRARTPVMDT